jgi:hypothetical protein
MQEQCELKLSLQRESNNALNRYRKVRKLLPRLKAVVSYREYGKMLRTAESLQGRAEDAHRDLETHIQSHGCD